VAVGTPLEPWLVAPLVGGVRLTPFFCRHALIEEDLDWLVVGARVGEALVGEVPPEVAVGVAVVAPFAAALALEAVPEELPPQAARSIQASRRTSTTALAAGVRLLLLT
jgi:hypothetical protein